MRAAVWLVAVLILLGAASPLWAGPFSEVPAGHWAYSECSRLASLGLLPSDRGANFSGNPQLTRFEFAVTVLDPLAGLDGAVAVLGGDASPTQWIEAAARGLGLSPDRSESEFSEAALALLRLSDEFGDELRALSFDAVPARQALRQLADARNVQAWRVEALAPPPRALALTGAPAAIVLLIEPKGTPYGEFWVQDASAAMENMLLAAVALGLAGCWVEGQIRRCEDRLRAVLGVPDNLRLWSLMPVGKPAVSPDRPPKPDVSEVAHYNHFGAARAQD